MIFRLLILLALIWLGFRIYYSLKNRPSKTNIRVEKGSDMVVCEKCGVYLPTANAISENGHYFCSRKHVSQKR